MLFQSVLPWEGNCQHSRELKQQTHFDVRSAIIFVGVIFVSLGGLFYICSKFLLVPVNVCFIRDECAVRQEWVGGGGEGWVSPAQRDFFL